MRIPAGVLLLATLLGAVLVLLAGQALLQPDLPLITDAGFTPQRISPNADGETDVAIFHYELSRNARITLQFEDADGGALRFPRGRSARRRRVFGRLWRGGRRLDAAAGTGRGRGDAPVAARW